jgi:spore coat polysaccharide biosynthesis protein SpsF (cytidylyltransferase family)
MSDQPEIDRLVDQGIRQVARFIESNARRDALDEIIQLLKSDAAYEYCSGDGSVYGGSGEVLAAFLLREQREGRL